MQRKDVPIGEVKADGGAGQFTALASVFDVVDAVGDVVLKGAFARSLAKWRQSGNPIPVILSHSWDDPMAHIGKADPHRVVETDRGLEVQGELDVADNATARQVHKLMKERRLTAWSFGYTVPEGGQARKHGVNEISEVDLIEVGPTLRGANPEAQLQAVKALREANNGTRETTGVPDREGAMAEEFRDIKRRWAEIDRKQDEERRKDREFAQMIEEINAETARDERRNRAVQIKRFTV